MASDPPKRLKAQFLRPNETLKRKALNFERGLGLTLSDEEIDRVTKAVDNSRDEFISSVATKLRAIRVNLPQAIAGGAEAISALLAETKRESYEIKGLGATFGFPLLTAIAKFLNDYVMDRRTLTGRQVEVVRLHVDMLYVVLAQRLTHIDPEREQELLTAFEELTTKIR